MTTQTATHSVPLVGAAGALRRVQRPDGSWLLVTIGTNGEPVAVPECALFLSDGVPSGAVNAK